MGVFFNIAPGVNIRYPRSLASIMHLVVTVVLLGVVVAGIVTRRVSIGRFLLGFASWLLSLLAASLLGLVVWWAYRRLNVDLHQFTTGGLYGSTFVFNRNSLSGAGSRRGFLLPVSPLVDAPCTLRCRIGVACRSRICPRRASARRQLRLHLAVARRCDSVGMAHSEADRFTLSACLPPSCAHRRVLLAPVVYLLAVFGARMEALLGLPLTAPLPLPFLVLLLGLLLPALETLTPHRRWLWPAVGWSGALALFCVAWLSSAPTASHPGTNAVVYWRDADRNTANWLALNDSRQGRGVRGTSGRVDIAIPWQGPRRRALQPMA